MNIRREHIVPRVWTDDENARFAKMWTEGKYISEIMRRFHVSKQTVQRQVRVLGLPLRPNPTNVKGATKPGTKPKPIQPLRPGTSTLPPLPSQETADV